MSSNTNLSSLRFKYKEKKDILLEENLKVKDPFIIFKEWMDAAMATEEILEPNAACLATVNKNGQPSNRFVLLKDFSKDGFTFFTNYASRKASDIAENPFVAMTLYWCPLRRSVRIEGKAEKVSPEKSLSYFHQRPRASQIGTLSSAQSQQIPSRQYLDKIEAELKKDLAPDKPVPMPNWGGYLIRPNLIEFWQGQTDRLHDRIRFRRSEEALKEVDGELVHKGEECWVYDRLAP